jgi:hypothetical protein
MLSIRSIALSITSSLSCDCVWFIIDLSARGFILSQFSAWAQWVCRKRLDGRISADAPKVKHDRKGEDRNEDAGEECGADRVTERPDHDLVLGNGSLGDFLNAVFPERAAALEVTGPLFRGQALEFGRHDRAGHGHAKGAAELPEEHRSRHRRARLAVSHGVCKAIRFTLYQGRVDGSGQGFLLGVAKASALRLRAAMPY